MKYKNVPYEHQSFYLKNLSRKRAFMLSAEMGTGKTFMVICNIAELWESGELDAVLVFAPNGVHSNWIQIELGKHMPDAVDWTAAEWRSGMGKARRAEFDKILLPQGRKLRILAMNWESLVHKSSFEIAQKFCESGKALMIVADESQNIKNPSSSTTKNLFKLRNLATWRRTMSGTPITQGPFDAFAQYSFLSPTILGTTSYYAFKAEYAEMEKLELQHTNKEGETKSYTNPLLKSIMNRSGNKRIPQVPQKNEDGTAKYRNLEKLRLLVAPYTYRVLKSECLDLPEKIYKTAVFDLTPQQRAAYKLAEEECRLLYEGEAASFQKLVAVTKLTQITSNYYIHPASEDPVRIEGPNPKLEVLLDFLRRVASEGKKSIVWARYHAEIEDVVEALRAEKGLRAVAYHGKVSRANQEEAKRSFQEDPETNVFVGQQKAGGSGITLTAASYVFYYSNDFSLTNRLQSEDRAHRIGTKDNVVYTDIVGRNTIDERVVLVLKAKKDVADIITGDGALLGLKR